MNDASISVILATDICVPADKFSTVDVNIEGGEPVSKAVNMFDSGIEMVFSAVVMRAVLSPHHILYYI